MRARLPLHPRWMLVILGSVLGTTAGATTVTLTSAAAQQTPVGTQAVLDATHVPPLLTVPGEPAELSYDVHCAASGVDDVDAGCDARGAVFVRAIGSGSYSELPLTERRVDGVRQLVATVPDAVASNRDGFEYYAVFVAPDLGKSIMLPAGGADAPHASRRLENAVAISLGRHGFGLARRSGTRVASAGWGTGPTDAGLEQGRNVGPIGASAFDVDAAGTVVVLDQANRRLLRWHKGARLPARVPLSIAGTIADLAVAEDGSVYVLETTTRSGRNPLVKRFDDGGRELEGVETAERTPSQILVGPTGPVVLGRPSHLWSPTSVNGTPAAPAEQIRRGKPSRPLRGGGRIVVFRHRNELRLALVSGRNVTRAWRVTSGTSLADVQLVEPIGQRLVVVARVFDEQHDEFLVLVLDRNGVVDRFGVDSADWAETAPLSRFRLHGTSLYRLGSSAAGIFVDRFDLEVHR